MKTIDFTPEMAQAIIDGKTQTRRLVKEGEHFMIDLGDGDEFLRTDEYEDFKKHYVKAVGKLSSLGIFRWNMRYRFKVGETYQATVNKKPVWWCPECGVWICPKLREPPNFGWNWHHWCKDNQFIDNTKQPLLIRITEIRKQNLLDISEEDAKKEGFDNKTNFLRNFCKVAKIKHNVQYPINGRYKYSSISKIGAFYGKVPFAIEFEKNPPVWALTFSKEAKR